VLPVQKDDTEILMLALADQLKLPLLQIAHLAETEPVAASDISTISRFALNLVDAYALASSQTQLELEPLTTASVLYDVAQTIDPLARRLNYQVSIDLKGNNKPVMGHRQTLKDMLFLLSASMMQAGSQDDSKGSKLVLGTHRSVTGTVVGAFCDNAELSQSALVMVRQLRGRASQSAPALGASGGSALAVADKLSQRLQAPLKFYRHNALTGIGSLLSTSSQLQLI
jgi:hypothetical protein